MGLFTTLWCIGAATSLALYIHLLVVMNEGSRVPATYGVGKMLFDMTLAIVLSWVSVPFIIVTLSQLKGKSAPMWTIRITSAIVIGVKKIIAGKQYK